MKDIDMFTTEYGVASLILKEIPYRKAAYIHIRSTQQLDQLLRECVRFCRMCGAESTYAADHPDLEKFPLYSRIFQMRGPAGSAAPACLWPVTAENAASWRQIYNEKMKAVDNSATLTAADEKQMLSDGGAYFVHEDGDLLGIGWLSGDELLAIASVKAGHGARVLQTLLSLAPGDTVTLEVASTNERAIHFYEKHGFVKTQFLRSWYCVDEI